MLRCLLSCFLVTFCFSQGTQGLKLGFDLSSEVELDMEGEYGSSSSYDLKQPITIGFDSIFSQMISTAFNGKTSSASKWKYQSVFARSIAFSLQK